MNIVKMKGLSLAALGVMCVLGMPTQGLSKSRFLDSAGEDLWKMPNGLILSGLAVRNHSHYTRNDGVCIQDPDRTEAANAFYLELYPEVYAYAEENDINMAGDVLESFASFRLLFLRSPHCEDPSLQMRMELYYYFYHCFANLMPQSVITVNRRDSLNQYRGMNLFDMTDLYFHDLRAWFLGEPLLFVTPDLFPRNKVFFDFFGTGLNGWKKYVDYFALQGYVAGDTYEVLELFDRNNWTKRVPETLDDFNTLLENMQKRVYTRAEMLDKKNRSITAPD